MPSPFSCYHCGARLEPGGRASRVVHAGVSFCFECAYKMGYAGVDDG